ncbi:glycosyltransferase family 4 protein [Archaeoglobus veneficus]|uniref:Glycosyl transferase group 1 n=1 Tax=Archaeoglobus veneficus (strain DSM 11195 / SNP6) TaxID=693661 RepID=F2KMN1_ARCVS|nr:glycosyltransferase family 4 protein [Archaeoglobus veneficus]AEA47228.1 glycosyl transferase group 1 [Archaeoglobus veneficus SNP6]
MRMTYFVDEYPPFFRGGLGTYAMEITRQFVKLGHTITVFSRNTGDDPTRDVWQGVEVHRPLLMDIVDVLPVYIPEDIRMWPLEAQEFFGETLLYNFLSASKLINRLVARDGRKFDIIVSHDWLAAVAGIITKKNLNIPFVFHFHSTEQGRTGDGSPTVKEVERMAGLKADLIVTVSYAMRDELVSLGHPEHKIRVVYNGVDAEKYRPNRFPEEEVREFRKKIGVENSPMILFIGRLAWVKGADTLVRAMPIILREVPNAKLVILGKGEQESLLVQLINSLGLQDSVITHFKYVSEEERMLYYAASDVVVFPSKYEPFGIVCTEAMAMGKPVVAGARGTSGLKEQVVPTGENVCGFHVNPYDPEDIAKFVVILLNDEQLRRKMGKNARRRVLECFTWEIAARNTISVYKEVMQGDNI